MTDEQDPAGNEPFNGLLFRISAQGVDAHGGANAFNRIWTQVQTRQFLCAPEMNVLFRMKRFSDAFADGQTYSLQKRNYTLWILTLLFLPEQ